MALKAILEKLDGLDEKVKAEYTQRDGKFYLDVEAVDGFALEDVRGLKSALEKEKENARKAEKTLKEFEGLDASAAKDALEKIKKLGEGNHDEKTKAQIESIKKQLTEQHAATLSEKEKSIAEMSMTINSLIIDNAAIAALDKADFQGAKEAFLPFVRSKVKVEKDSSGNYRAEVLNESGQPRVNAKGDMLSIGEWVSELKGSKEFAPYFKGANAAGSGANGDAKGGAGGSGIDPNLPPIERISRARAAGMK